MNKRLAALALGLAIAVFAAAAHAASTLPRPTPTVPVKGMVTMVDLGAKTCIPCRMMAPILVDLEKEYRGRAAVVFIDVTQDRAAAARFGVRAIPTQVFFDGNGREVARHEGFMDKKGLSERLNRLLAK